jgi:DNA-directed RNA polymerase subunit omega
MAILQSTDSLEEYIGNKYSLVIVAAKRARQLKEGHPPLSEDRSTNFLSIALREVDERKLQPIVPPPEELAPAPRDVISSLVAGVDFDLGDGEDDLDLEDGDAVDDLAALLVGTDEEEEEEEPEAEEDLLTPVAVVAKDETADEEETEDEEETLDETEDAGLDEEDADEG